MALLQQDPTEMLGGTPADNSGPIVPGSVTNPSLPAYSAPAAAAPAPAGDPNAAADSANAATATGSISATLTSLGLGGMVSWASTLASTLAGKGISSSDIVNTITSQMNAPTNADGSVNQSALDSFNSAMPGFNQLIANTGQNGSPGSSPAQAIAAYVTYGAQVQAFASTLGLPAGTISSQDIGNYWADQKSTTEVSERLTDVNAAVQTMPSEVKDYLSNTYNMTPAQITAYYINPTNTINQINQMNNSAYVGGEAAITGFDKNMSLAQSRALGAFLANGSSAGSSSDAGQINAITAGTAQQAFGSTLGNGIAGSVGQLAGLEGTTPGQGAGVDENTLLAAMGVAGLTDMTQQQALNATSNVQQARTASNKGGGGAATTSNGAVGIGYANS